MLVYICLLLLCCSLYSNAAPVGNTGIHILQLKSFRGSSIQTDSEIHASGNSKLISGGIKLLSHEDDTPPLPPAKTFGPGLAELKSDKDILWYTTITIGTGEGQEEFDVDVDTGSSDLFIPGVKCGANCDGHTRYDPLRSATSRDTGKKFNLDFADKSSVTGSVYTDSVSLGGLVAEGQGFGVGDVYSDGLARDIFSPDGLMGLGFQALSHIGSPPLIDTLYNQKKIKQRMFGVRLDLARLNGEQGELTLGGYNEHHVAGEITYTYVNDAKYWQVQLDEASVGSKVLASNVNFIVDTGSTLINADAQFVENLYSGIVGASRVENSKRWTLPCASIPTLVFTINGKQFPISVNSFSPGRISEGSDLCYGGVVANVEPKEPWIVGGVFLSSVYTVFDTDQKRVGFSALKGTLGSEP